MKITMLKCIESLNGFSKLSQCDLPFKLSYTVAQNVKNLEAIVKPFEEKRNEFIESLKSEVYSDDDGKQVVSDEAAEKFSIDVRELLDEDHEVHIKKINMYGVEAVGIKPSDIKGCIDFIEMSE